MKTAGRVLLVVGPATGGMGSHVSGLATGLPGLGWSVTVFTSPRTAERFALGESVVTGWPGAQPNAQPNAQPGGRESGPAVRTVVRAVLGMVRAVRELRRLIAEADVVHAHGHQAGLLSVLTAATRRRRHRPPVVVTWHNAVLGAGPKRQVLALAEVVQARAARLVTGASDDLVERARALGARTARLSEVAAPTPVVVSRADETAADTVLHALLPRERERVGEGEGERAGVERGPVVLTVSRIAAQKRLDVLVEAAALLQPRIPGLRWLVAGDGDPALLAALTRRATALAAPVIWLGARGDVPALMAGADVFALPSAWEARALVVQEAMAAGLPVVATSVGGLPGLLGDTGLLVPPGDAGALADAVQRLVTDRWQAARLARAARERFAALPTESEVVTGWSQEYQRLTRSA